MTGEIDMKEKERQETAMRISRVSIGANVILSGVKLIAGILAHSNAMLSDAVHSLSDVLSTFVVMIGVHISGKEADEEHPYGHERYECAAAIILAVMLAVTGAGIGLAGIRTIRSGTDHLVVPGLLALGAAIVSIVVKEAMFWYTKKGADRIRSGALLADAWHHRSDAMSSVGSLIGIAGARLGYPILDPLAGIVICLFIFKAAYDIFKDALKKMVDESVEEEIVTELRRQILQEEGVLKVDDIRTRVFGARYYVDVEIAADGQQSLSEAHDIAERVHDHMEELFPDIKHIMVHVNPLEA
jgi:cation diffusion facilitator family transporter